MNWQEEFDYAMKQFDLPQAEEKEFRLHYDETGRIVMCSMVNHPTSFGYIVVDSETYENYFRYHVNISKKVLEKIDFDIKISVKLKKSDQGQAVVKNHAGLLLEPGETYENIEYYDTIN